MTRYFVTAGLMFIYLFSQAQFNKMPITDPLFIKAQEHFTAFRYDSAALYYEKGLQAYRQAGNKRNIAATLKGLGDVWVYQKKYEVAIPAFEEAIKIWEQLGNNDREIASALTSLGAIYMYQGKPAASRAILQQAIRTFSKLDDKNALLTAYLNLGANDSREGNYSAAMESYLSSLKMAEALGNKRMMAYNYLNLGSANLQINELDRALENLEKSLSIAREIGDKPATATSLQNMVLVLKTQNKFVEARKHLDLAIPLFKELKDDGSLQGAQMNLGRIYEAEGDYANALKTYLEANEMMNSATIPWLKVGNYQYIASMYNKLHQPLKARPWLEKALTIAKELKSDPVYADVYSNLSDTDSLTGNYDNALYNYKQYIFYKEKVFNEKNIKKTATLELQYANEKKADSVKFINQQQQLALQKEIQLAALQHEYEAKQARVKSEEERLRLQQEEAFKRQAIESDFKMAQLKSKQEQAQLVAHQQKQEANNKIKLQSEKNLRNLSLAGLLLIAVVGGLLFYQNRLRRKTNTTLLNLNNELDEANKVKTKFFGILSHDLRSPIVNLLNFLHLQKEMPELFSKERQAYHQKELTESAESLLETMEAMLLWSKSQMEHFAPQKKIILVQSLFEFLQKQFSVSGISFQDPGQLMVSSDEDYLKTIMYNLTANAVKALANTENPQIAWKARQNGNQVELSITDNGPGVHEEQLDALYNENAVVGTRHGLGLHLIRDLAKAINCRVLHQPGFEKGSVFQIIM